jgi:hypothetical protein
VKKNTLKLRLSKETLAKLDGDTWKRVVGGVSLEDHSTCTYCTGATISHTDCCPPKV